jgi:hypothetical protein
MAFRKAADKTDPSSQPSLEHMRRVFALIDRSGDEPLQPGGDPSLDKTVAGQRRVAQLLRQGGPAMSPALIRRLDAKPARRRTLLAPTSWAARGRLRPSFVLGAGLAAVVVGLILTFGSPSRSLSATQVAAEWKLPATAAAAQPDPGAPSDLDVRFQGTSFPNYHDSEGWHPAGTRPGRIDGHAAFTVYYVTGARRAAYTVVAASDVSVPATARRSVVDGLRFVEYRDRDRWVLVFRDRGNTCVLTAAAPRERLWLVKLAVWRRTTASESPA